MFSKEEIKSNLIGCAEIFLFMRNGIDRFIVSPSAAVQSFMIPLLLAPLSIFVSLVIAEAGMHPAMVFLYFSRTVLALVLYLSAVYFLAKQYHREDGFYRFLVIFNWMNLIGLIYLLPIAVGVLIGYPVSMFESYAVFVTLTGYVYLAFVLTHCFRYPWEMAGFLAIVGLAIDDNLFKLVEAIQSAAVL